MLTCQRDNFRQQDNTALYFEPEVLKKMTPKTLRLLGYYKGRTGGGGYLGRDPVDQWEPLQGYTGGEWFPNEA